MDDALEGMIPACLDKAVEGFLSDNSALEAGGFTLGGKDCAIAKLRWLSNDSAWGTTAGCIDSAESSVGALGVSSTTKPTVGRVAAVTIHKV